METGLGGLYDSTNVINYPLCSIITTIDFDHTARLGDTIEEIAKQKAGIVKTNSYALINENNLGLNVVRDYCKQIGARFFEVKNDIKIEFKNGKNYAKINDELFEFALLGEHQAQNLALALSAIKVLPFNISNETIKIALKNVCWKFRLEYDRQKNLLIDGAHNPSGILSLRNFLDNNFKNEKITFIFGCLNNKDYKNMLKTLIKSGDKFYFYEFDYPNALKFEQLPQEIKQFAKTTSSPFEIIEKEKGLKVVCGSLYMLGNLFNPG